MYFHLCIKNLVSMHIMQIVSKTVFSHGITSQASFRGGLKYSNQVLSSLAGREILAENNLL